MKASKGDSVVVPGRHVGDVERHGTITEVRGRAGEPPYVVRWEPGGEEHLFFPGPDCRITTHTR